MSNMIRHSGEVVLTDGTHLRVRILKEVPCSSCGAKKFCNSADSVEKFVDIIDDKASSYKNGDKVWLVGTTSMGVKAVWYGIGFPFLILIISLFVFSYFVDSELIVALLSLALLMPYYIILSFQRKWLDKHFLFTVSPYDSFKS